MEYKNDFNNLTFEERSKVYDKEYDLFDEECVWDQIWKRAEKRVWNHGAIVMGISMCLGIFTLLLIGSAGIFAVTENLLLKMIAGFAEVWIIVGVSAILGLLWVRKEMPKHVEPLYGTYLHRHRERMKITRMIKYGIEELKENILRKGAKET